MTPNKSPEPPLALAVPLSRFRSQVGGGSAFFVRRHYTIMKIKIILSVVAGFVLDVAAMWFVVKQTTVKVFATQYLVSAADQANVALHIRAGKQMELVTNIEAALPSYVLTVDEGFKGQPGSTEALWMVKAYYERNQIAIPPEIKGILDSLPPKPPTSCQIRLRALDKSTATNTADSRGLN